MKVVIPFGPPGAGKGTQCELLSKRLGCEHISTGTLIRSEIASASALGKQVKELVEGGSLVNDEMLFACLESRLQKGLFQGTALLLDGVPRTLSQVALLDALLPKYGLKVDAVLALVAPTESLVARFAKRWTCSVCSSVASFENEQLAQVATCNNCQSAGTFARRKDDSAEAISKRLEIYQEVTAPILRVYRERGLVSEFDGLKAIEHVYLELGTAVVKK